MVEAQKRQRVNFREIVANRTKNDPLFHFAERCDQPFEICLRRAHDVKRQALRDL